MLLDAPVLVGQHNTALHYKQSDGDSDDDDDSSNPFHLLLQISIDILCNNWQILLLLLKMMIVLLTMVTDRRREETSATPVQVVIQFHCIEGKDIEGH